MSDMDPRSYYDDLAEGEWERLAANPVARLEFETTTEYLERYLPAADCASVRVRPGAFDHAPVRVLDAGGGPGRYTCWLAERGYEVAHCDLSAEQVRLARERVGERDLGGRVAVGQADVRDLPYGSDEFDAVCCLGGPLSHVLDADERERALCELGRVARDGAPVFVSVIGRLAAVRFGMKHGGHPGVFGHVARTGDYTDALLAEHDEEGWADCHFFRADEPESAVEAAGLGVETLVGLEGLAAHLQDDLEDAGAERIEGVRDVHGTLCEERSVVDTSEHILAVCRN